MLRTIELFDTTLRDGEQSPGAAMTASARLGIARSLDAAGIDTIEAGFPAASAATSSSVAQIARAVGRARVAALARCVPADIEAAAEALHGAARPRIHVFLATSDLHLRHKLRITQPRALELVAEGVRHARRLCPDVEFSAEDATRSDRTFLAEAFSVAIECGASTINVPDTVGYALPAEMAWLLEYLRTYVRGIEAVALSVHTHDDLGMATANALAAVEAGASQVECTVNGIGERAGNCALEEIVCAIHTRREALNCETRFDRRSLQGLSHLVARSASMPVQKNKAIVGENAFAHESGIHQDGVLKERTTYEIIDPQSVGRRTRLPLGRNSGRHALLARIEALGFDAATANRAELERAFKALAQTKRNLRDDDVARLAAAAGCRRAGRAAIA
jgi:2-isopropylmalate synthase